MNVTLTKAPVRSSCDPRHSTSYYVLGRSLGGWDAAHSLTGSCIGRVVGQMKRTRSSTIRKGLAMKRHKRVLLPVLVLGGIVAWGALGSGAAAGEPKVQVCHRPPGNPNNYPTIT